MRLLISLLGARFSLDSCLVLIHTVLTDHCSYPAPPDIARACISSFRFAIQSGFRWQDDELPTLIPVGSVLIF